VQIILGAGISFLPFGFDIELNPDLFFVLFIAPLVYNTSMLLDKKTFWSLKAPIMNMACILVLLTVIGVGYCIHAMIPALPVTVAFMLVGALAPTDDVAIISVSQRVPIPRKLMNILTGESIINDATGIVCFQFALAAVVSGSFSSTGAVGQLFAVGIGGLLVGLLFTGVKYLFVRWIRRLGMENVTLHILIEILTPFFVYLLAEKAGVSGILAVFAAGITHSLGKKKLNPDTANLTVASKSIWNMISFTFEGIVYLILGTQLPRILQTLQSNTGSWTVGILLIYILMITLAFAASRYIWFYLTACRKSYSDSGSPVKKWKASLIFSLSGARGAVTMASVLSIPVLLSNGVSFPQRDLIILLSTGVILCSLFITNFILPAIAGKSGETDREAKENEACIELLNNVADTLERSITKDNWIAGRMILSLYKSRIKMQDKLNATAHIDKNREKALKMEAWKWEKQNTVLMLENEEINDALGNLYVYRLDKRISIESGKINNPFRKPAINFGKKGNKHFRRKFHDKEFNINLLKLRETNDSFVIGKLKELQQTNDSSELKKLLSEYESDLLTISNMITMHDRRGNPEIIENAIAEVASAAFQIERDNIQAMFEAGRISREKARELRNNIMLMETELK
jgi:CPA1 family monovalent cation:H+ antiporter